MTSTLGEMIRTAREQQGITLRGLAKKAGVSAPFLSDVEHGRRALGDSLNRVAKALSLSRRKVRQAVLFRSVSDFVEKNPDLADLLSDRECPCCRRYGPVRR